MPTITTSLKLDAVVTGANGVAYLVAAGPLGDLLGLSPALLRGAGTALVVFALAVWATGASRRPSPEGVLAIAAANVAWSAGSLVAAVLDAGSPTTTGTVWIVLQALVVAAFAELQVSGRRRLASAA